MLRELRISNIVLIESAAVQFGQGFNVLSGESGAGKSAIMNALALITGARCDTSAVRRGTEKGIVEAIFEIDQLPHLHALLEGAGIDHEKGAELFIKREVSIKGKNRAFINNQLAQPGLLRQVAELLFHIAGQHANQRLLSTDYHRHVIDLYGGLEQVCGAFAKAWEEERETVRTLQELVSSEAQRAQEIEMCKETIEELRDAAIKEGEEEQLFAEYSRLSNADMLLTKVAEINRSLQGEKPSILSLLSRQKILLEQLTELVPELSETAAAFGSALLELVEAAHVLRRFESQVEFNPVKAAELNKRLELINHIKRKYNLAYEEIQPFLKGMQERLQRLENAESQIEELQEKAQLLSSKSTQLANILTEKRKAAALMFQEQMAEQLRALNMPKAEFFVEVTDQKRSSHGDDGIEFFLTPNVGEHRVPVRGCASGGELSRIMLAIQALLAGKERIPCLIFDEIDANIGGETAAIIGKKLKEIGSNHQILCITHFPQVAVQAEHHLRVHKKEIDGRTVSLVDLLHDAARHAELARMQGASK
jgi:DNA repair protein RecN (Recombination protein N)